MRGVSLEVRRGEILCVVGESGSGKSALVSAIMGGAPRRPRPGNGEHPAQGRGAVGPLPRAWRAIRGRRIAMIPQEPMAALNPCARVGAQIEEVFAIHGVLTPAKRQARALALIGSTRLPDPVRIAARYPHQLSGGQCQRVCIAMALALDPEVLIADEPTTALDVTTQAQVLGLMRELKDAHGHGVVFITHDLGVVAEIADRIAVMKGGELVETGAGRAGAAAPAHPYTRMLMDAAPGFDPATARLPAPCAGRGLPAGRRARPRPTDAGARCGARGRRPGGGDRLDAGGGRRERVGQEHARQGADPPDRPHAAARWWSRARTSPALKGAPLRGRGARSRWCSRTPTARSTPAAGSAT